MTRVLITGAAGTIGKQVSTHLIDKYELTLVDHSFEKFPEKLKTKANIIEANLSKRSSWDGLLDDIDIVIQFAADPSPEAEFYDSLLDANYKLPHNLYDEALKSDSLKRIIFASSIHTIDAYPPNKQVSPAEPPRPNDLYGVSKVYLEALAAHYAYTHGVESIGIRIGDYKSSLNEFLTRSGPQGLAAYLSKDDFNHLIDCCLTAQLSDPLLIINGLSANTFNRMEIESAREKVGYQPTDNAFESYPYNSK